MSKNCKHPIKLLTLMAEERYGWPDGYGGEGPNWFKYFLVCDKCKKQVQIPTNQNDYCVLENDHYFLLTGRHLKYSELKKIFKQNKNLSKHIQIDCVTKDNILRDLGYRTSALERKIKAKKRLIEKHKKELREMVIEYNGGESVSVHYY